MEYKVKTFRLMRSYQQLDQTIGQDWSLDVAHYLSELNTQGYQVQLSTSSVANVSTLWVLLTIVASKPTGMTSVEEGS